MKGNGHTPSGFPLADTDPMESVPQLGDDEDIDHLRIWDVSWAEVARDLVGGRRYYDASRRRLRTVEDIFEALERFGKVLASPKR